jgi:hypothetical protein
MTTMKPRIAVLNLGVADLARSRAFYEGMGWVARPESSERAVFFELEWSWLALFPRDRLASLSKSSPEGSGYPGFCFSHNVKTPPIDPSTTVAEVRCSPSQQRTRRRTRRRTAR